MDLVLDTEILKLENSRDEIFTSTNFYINYWL